MVSRIYDLRAMLTASNVSASLSVPGSGSQPAARFEGGAEGLDVVVGTKESYMSRSKSTLAALNIHQAPGATKSARSGKVTIEVPATLSEARKMLAASYRRAGFSGRQAALMVDQVVSKVRSKRVAA